jgi:APA family basic amino acid/polyamine antiporter
MGRGGDLPALLAHVHERRRTPDYAVLLVGAVVLVVTLVGGIVGAVWFSAFTVLLYYAIANASALRLRPDERLAPGWIPVLGLLGCVALAASLPWPTMLAGALALVLLLGARRVVLR